MSMCIRSGLVALAALSVACSVQDTPIPPLAGPSELGLRVALQAIPDSILQDGFSQASLQIEATTADGRPARALSLRLQTEIAGVVSDIGTLSAKTVVTGEDGRARVTYTSPPRPTQQVEPFTVVTFRVEPIGTDYRGEIYRTVDLRLVVPGIIQPPPPQVELPQARFTVTGNAVLTNVVFDASTSLYDRGTNGVPQLVPCGQLCTYIWDFGDGTTGSGIFASHQYRNVARYQVKLTITDPYGQIASTAQPVEVGVGGQPSAAFTFSPSAPAVNQQIFFTAEASRASAGRTLVSYDWNFGNGRTGGGQTIRQAYSATGNYTVTLTVTDDAGNQATTSQAVSISLVGSLQAVLRVSPPNGGTPATIFQFDGAESVPGSAPIVEYRFNFGDNTPDQVGGLQVATHQFAAAGTYQVSLQVKDSLGRTDVSRLSVTVTSPTPGGGGGGPLQASLTATPTSGQVNVTDFVFDASGSTSTGSAIVSYTFNFPDGTTQGPSTQATATKRFSATGSQTVSVLVRTADNNAQTATRTVTVNP
jgi:PKD repeat protein